ncbi:protease [Bdellovibrio bacteriovorus]|uniref:protease n=1 Tax=Bdellovibrio bacteriovorus TaxID=959 RepID=UPI003A7FDA4F
MTNLMKFAAVAMLLISAQSANAISLRFKFKTFSSGPDIYACNAGLKHNASAHKACYFEDTQIACTAGTCTDATCHTRCVCTNDNGGEYLMDYMKGQYSSWNTGDSKWNTNWTATTRQAGQGSFATLVNHEDAFANRIKELSFNLGSELYGAEYFVDICYRGPQIEYWEDNVVANFSLLAQVSATDFVATGVNPGDNNPDGPGFNHGRDGLNMTPNIKYTTLSGLTVESYTVCDLQGMNTFKYARNNANQYNMLDNEAKFSDWNAPQNGGGDFFTGTNQPTTLNGAKDLYNTWINQNTKTPRFCRVRYVFKETNHAAAIKNLRKWQRHGAEMCTYTKIEEGAAN